MNTINAPVFIVGCGDIGKRVARLWRSRGTRVSALARSDEAAEVLAAHEITAVRGDLDEPASLQGLPTGGSIVYYFAPPPNQGTTDPRMRSFVSALANGPQPRRIVYISTSGVYGDRGGAWVDESAEPHPATDRAQRRLDAETTVRDWGRENDVPVIVLRVGGIYGPGRLPTERLRQGTPVLRPEESQFTNRIHADDLAAVCLLAAEKGRPDAVYNVSDGNPGTMTEYFFAVADQTGIPRPPTITLEQARTQMSEAMLSYLTESRRLDTTRLREELGFVPRYADLDAGLDQILREAPSVRAGDQA